MECENTEVRETFRKCGGKITTVIVKVTERCNLKCVYCFQDFDKNKRLPPMSFAVAEAMFEKVLSSDACRTVEFIWHGGEPLDVGIPYFKEMLECQSAWAGRLQKSVLNSVQTNGTLIDDAWANLFRQYGIDVGVSIDFPQSHHDAVRPTSDGTGSFEEVLRGIKILRRHSLSPGAITILTALNVQTMREMYDFFQRLRLSFRPNIYFPERADPLNPLIVSPAAAARAFITLFDLWYNDPEPIGIDIFDDIIESMIIGESRACTFNGGCADFLTIRPNGDTYCCDRFMRDDFKLGNILVDPIEKLRTHSVMRRFAARSDGLEKCRSCEWFPLCRGGCPTYSFCFHGIIDLPDYYCAMRKALFHHIYRTLRKEVNNHGDREEAHSRRACQGGDEEARTLTGNEEGARGRSCEGQ